MKNKAFKTKLLTVLLTLCMLLSLVPLSVFAATPATETADFTVGQGREAITLLNQYKTGTAESLWDNTAKTLTLWGVDFTTTAQTAVKLPAGATIVLKDGTHNTIQSGDVSLEVSGGYSNATYINALDAAGSLTIEGGTAGSGTLSVFAGKLKNSGDGWVYSSGISVDGDFTVKGGRVTARGGCAESDGSCFSFGVKMDSDTKNKALLVTGGTLTAIADEAYELEEGGTKRASFSRGVEMFRGNVIVSGSGKLRAESVEAMAEATVMSNGLYISAGNLTVANSAEVAVAGAYAAYISGGSLRLDGGSLTAVSTQTADDNGNLGCAIDMDMDLNKQVADSGSITVSGGTLETVNGDIRMSTIGATGNQSLFTVTGGTIVNRGQLYGPKKLDISGGTMQTQGIEAEALTLSDGSLTIREPVRKNPNYDNLLVRPALDVKTLTVSGGTLDAAWDWGQFTPIVFPVNTYYGYTDSLVEMTGSSSVATFTGGTTTLDTGKAGNTALLIKGQLTIGDGMAETGADSSHRQLGTAPVKIAAAAASTAITTVDVANVKLDYQPGNTPKASAKRTGTNQDKYDILFECWEKREKDANDTVSTVAYWYSDESCYSDGNVQFNTFEKGGRYRYSVKLQAKDGYTFDSNLTNRENVTLNGASLPSSSWVMVMDDGKTCLIQYGTELRPGQTVEEIRLDAIINFNAGDKPLFSTGIIDPIVDTDHQRWDANDGSCYGITSSDYWNERYNGKLITEFEADKSYTYGVYFKISDLGMEEGYRFDQNTKLYINGEEITLTPDQIDVDDSGETIWFMNVLTMTPTTVKVIDVVEINNVTVSFKDGDKPVFTGKSPEGVKYAYNCEWWELDSKTGAISADFFSGAYENKITAFEAGKTYHYGVYVKAVGYVESENTTYLFGPNTKLKINGEFVNYTRYEGDESDGSDGTMWVLTALAMTPEAGGTTPAEKYTVTYTDGVDGEEIFKDQVYTVEFGKATPAFNGTPARDGYKFTGWTPAVADTVTRNATYTAQWEKLTPAETFTVTYTDGVDNEEIFKDQVYTVEFGKATPAFNGTPARDGYKFTGWTPAVADTVTRNATYTAQWEKLTPAETFTVTYTDGVGNEEIFKDQVYTVEFGKATPAFNGTPTRDGYTFAGWKPAVAATVTSNATYEATWKSDSATTTPSDNKPSTGETTSPNTGNGTTSPKTGETTSLKTGDNSNLALWFAVLFISGGVLTVLGITSRKKSKNALK